MARTQKNPTPPAAQPTTAPFDFLPFRNDWLPALLLFAVAFLFYANSLQNQYAVDDYDVLLRAESVMGGARYIPNILANDMQAGRPLTSEEENLFGGGRYRPLSIVTFALEKSVWPGDDTYRLSHFINVLLYALTCALAFFWLRRYLFPRWRDLAFVAVFLFAIHPIHTEVVANIKSRDEIMSLLFIVLTFIGLGHAAQSDNKRTQLLATAGGCAAYFLALLSRESGITLLALLPLTLHFAARLPVLEILKRSAPYFGVALLYLALRFAVIGFGSNINYQDELNNPFLHADFGQKYATIVALLFKDLKMLVWPAPLCWDYSWKQIFPYNTFAQPVVWLSLLLNGGAFAWAVRATRRREPIAYGVWFYFAALSIVSNLVLNIGVAFAERFLYMPSLGFCLAAAGLMLLGVRRLPAGRFAALAVVLSVLAVPAFLHTWKRNAEWKDHQTLALADVVRCPNSAKTNINAGDVCLFRAKTAKDEAERLRLLNDAVRYYARTVELLPNWFIADSSLKTARGYLTTMYFEKAKAADAQGDKDASAGWLEQITVIDPKAEQVWSNLSGLYETTGQADKAIAATRRLTELKPENPEYWSRLGTAHFKLKNDFTSAIPAFERTTRLQPQNPVYWHDLGVAYYYAGRKAEAQAAMRQALAVDPNHAPARQALTLMK